MYVLVMSLQLNGGKLGEKGPILVCHHWVKNAVFQVQSVDLHFVSHSCVSDARIVNKYSFL